MFDPLSDHRAFFARNMSMLGISINVHFLRYQSLAPITLSVFPMAIEVLCVQILVHLYIHRHLDSATECRILGASKLTLSIPCASFSFGFPFGGLPNRGASKVPLSIPPTCWPTWGASKVTLSIPGPA